jgi:hypothetical protein
MGAVAWTAFVAGVAHVVSGPDHLAAVGPFSVTGRGAAWKVGLRWGLGHAAGTILVGLLALGARELLPIELLSVWGERLVGAALILLGVLAIRALLKTRVHTHVHTHGEVTHTHIHAHADGDLDHAHGAHLHDHSATSFGLLHGVAGGSHLVGALPALGLASAVEAGSYLVAFAVGAIAAMVAFTASLGAVTHRLGHRASHLADLARWVFAVGAVVVGAIWLVLAI